MNLKRKIKFCRLIIFETWAILDAGAIVTADEDLMDDEFKNSDFVIPAIDVQEKRGVVKRYAENEKLPFPVLLDINGRVSFDCGQR
jgi:hypothetical protein